MTILLMGHSRRSKRLLSESLARCLFLLSLLCAVAMPRPAHGSGLEVGSVTLPAGQQSTGRVLVRFKPHVPAAAVRTTLRAAGAYVVDKVEALRIVVLRPTAGRADRLVTLLRQDPNVAFAAPERILRATYIPNDTLFPLQWGQLKINALQGWSISKGSTAVKLAVVDTGVDYKHSELRGRYAGGYDFVNQDAYPLDDNGHGTHVAGIAVATGNNGQGTAGVGWYTKVLAVKVLDGHGVGSDTDVSKGIVWAADNGASVINLSLGGDWYSQALADAVKYAMAKGALVVAAAGNEATNTPSYPAALPGVIGVAATNELDMRADFSNYGAYVDISGPGTNILSTMPGNEYGYMSGTSMATPFVAGAAAVVKAKYPTLSASQVWTHLKMGADDVGATGYDQYTGYGRLNLYRALARP